MIQVYKVTGASGEYLTKSIKVKGISFKLCPPNIMSVCWVIICLKIIVTGESASRNIFDYLLFSMVVGYMMISIGINKGLEKTGWKILFLFLLLIGITMLGMVRNMTTAAITSVVGVFCVMALVLSCGFHCKEIQPLYIKPIFYFVIFRLLIRTINGDALGNTTPGVLCFLTYGFIISIMNSWGDGSYKRNNIIRFIDVLFIIIAFALMIYIGWVAEARTAVLTGMGILAVYVFLSIKRYNRDKINRLYWIICIASLLLTIAYINIRIFSWYDILNLYSQSMFEKNVDSSRPALWSYSLSTLSWIEIIIGKGTGILPTFREYQSFHNSFIQLVMQNGFIGLIVLILIFRKLWRKIAERIDDKVCRMVLACFAGVIVYNLFESTLLQNKVFLGMCEWIVICMGIVRNRELIKRQSSH